MGDGGRRTEDGEVRGTEDGGRRTGDGGRGQVRADGRRRTGDGEVLVTGDGGKHGAFTGGLGGMVVWGLIKGSASRLDRVIVQR